MGRDLQILRAFWRVRGREVMDFLRGVRIMIEDGDMTWAGLGPGDGLTSALIQQLEKRDETSIWSRATTAAWRNPERVRQPARRVRAGLPDDLATLLRSLAQADGTR